MDERMKIDRREPYGWKDEWMDVWMDTWTDDGWKDE